MTNATPASLDPKLLDVLRCPVAVHNTDSADPGRLELVRGSAWLYSPDSGYKYPVVGGIPKMLVEEGARWKDTPIDDLPVPAPSDEPTLAAEAAPPAAPPIGAVVEEARANAARELSAAADAIRQEAAQADGPVREAAETVAGGLSRAADYLEHRTATQMADEATASVRRSPWRWVVGTFVAGLVAGLFLRGGGRR